MTHRDKFADGERAIFVGNMSTESDLAYVRGLPGYVTPFPLAEYDREERGPMYWFTADAGHRVAVFEDEIVTERKQDYER